jgi:Phage integrase, N-terminal SAM-like domain
LTMPAYLSDIERSPNTVKAYAHDLKDWFGFLAERGLDWRAVQLDDVGEFVAWLRLPLQARDGRVAVLPSVPHHCTESTVNRKLSAVALGVVGRLEHRHVREINRLVAERDHSVHGGRHVCVCGVFVWLCWCAHGSIPFGWCRPGQTLKFLAIWLQGEHHAVGYGCAGLGPFCWCS